MPDYLGEFEQLILFALARLGDDAYGVTVRRTLVERAGRNASFGAIYSTLRRLEQKGLVRSAYGDPEPVRGGRAKKHVALTARGRAALRQTHAALLRMARSARPRLRFGSRHVRHPLNWVLRLSVPDDDRQALLRDLEEEYRSGVRPVRSWAAAQVWHIGQVIAAAWAFTGGNIAMTSRPLRRPLRTDDVRDALRRWRRRPGFPLAATLTLGLGIGAATAMFSVVDAVLLRLLPWPDPDRLAVIHAVYPERRTDQGRRSPYQ